MIRNTAGDPTAVGTIRIGCSGWVYRSWRGVLYPDGLPQRRWLERYAEVFDVVEINSTHYRLARPAAAQGWLDQTPDDFAFAVKTSRFLTHMRRLTDLGQGVERFYEGIAPLAASPKLASVLWQLPPSFRRDDDRLLAALEATSHLPPGRHAWEFRDPSWFVPEVLDMLRAHVATLVVGDHPDRPYVPLEVTSDRSFVRFHFGARGRRGNYSETELREWAPRLRELADRTREVLVFFNNDWEGFAVRNALRMRRLLGLPR
jgi:uncharacterized protein YecE (DUF72 family)